MESQSDESTTEAQRAAALAYLKGELSEAERRDFEEALTESETLREELARSRALLDALASAEDPAITAVVNDIIVRAIEQNASDIHVLPQRHDVLVQIRVDGSMRELARLTKHQQQAVIDRWKMMADMLVGENQVPQDGRIPLRHKEADFDMRVNTLPTLYGERITTRILYRSTAIIGMENIELSAPATAALSRLARLESGLIVTSGHSGVGKTTLLYSLLLEMQKDERRRRNLLTIEDPIEHQLNGVSQTQVNRRAGLTFPIALRSMMRCDPDVILCGEIRERESAGLVVGIALTGSLVLSALHTTSAIGIIQRLRDIGVENFQVADTLAGVIGQRLVRRIDPAQTETYQPADEELRQVGLTRADGPFVRGVASEGNGGTGFKGRIPLIEVAAMTLEMRRLITENAPLEDIQRVAFGKGGSLRADGIARVKAGLTTVEEVNRVLSDYPF